MYTDRMATKSTCMNATKPYRTVPFITSTCIGKALHDLALCMLSTTHTHHTKLKRQFNLFTSDAAYLEVWDHVNKVLGQNEGFVGCLQQKSCMEWSRKLGGAL